MEGYITGKSGPELRMPSKFAYMTEKEMEYGGSCWTLFFFLSGGLCLLGGAAFWGMNRFYDIGDERKMNMAAISLCALGAALVVGGIISCCKGSTGSNSENPLERSSSLRMSSLSYLNKDENMVKKTT